MSSLSNPAYSTPQNRDGSQAAIDEINAAGGVDGHPLKLDFCDTNFDPNKELSCARQLVADKVAAVINPAILADPSGAEYKLFSTAKIPLVGGEGVSPTELSTSVAFPLSSGLPGWFYGAVDALVSAGSKKIAAYVAAGPSGQFIGSILTDALKSAGITPAVVVTSDPKADPTYDASAAKLTSSGADGVVLAAGNVDIAPIVKALRGSGYKGRISSITALFSPATLTALGSTADGILLASQLAFTTDTSNPAIVQFQKDMKQYEPKAIVDETTLFSWSGVQLLAKVALAAKAYTAPAILAAMAGLSTRVDIGTAAPYSTSGTSPLPSYPRIFNPTVQFGTIESGALVASGKGFVNPFTALKHG